MAADPNHRNYVWINVDAVDAVLNNNGTLPKGWKSHKKRERNSYWGWTRAFIESCPPSSPSSSSSNTSELNGRSWLASSRTKSSVLRRRHDKSISHVTLTVHDSEFAPLHLKGKKVSLSYNCDDNQMICNANTWWNDGSNQGPPADLTSLTHLHEPSVVYCLKRHYQQNSIYIYTGKILLALNPFQTLDNVYGENAMEYYWRSDSHLESDSIERPPPHVYAIAQDAYRSLLIEGDDQSILVSGESGSGKTMTTKYIMGYLAKQSQRNTLVDLTESDTSRRNNNNNECGGIELQIVQSNPILESFGNARTIRNDNSSRFGKFIELFFSPGTGQLTSASIKTYLLEKVRLVSQAPGERNYHIFYELLAGLSQHEREKFGLRNCTPKDFRMTSHSGTYERRDGVADKQSFITLRSALRSVGFTETQENNLFVVTCALLHISNITFKSTLGEGSEINDSQSLLTALKLLGVSREALNDALCVCSIRARQETFYKKLSIGQATKAIEALVKATYRALFDHLVGNVNESIANNLNVTLYAIDIPRIGVLDIFGFESFERNSFEQLCINYCNEALQQQFNKFVFKLEQQEYEQEGIDWSFIEFPDNEDILQLIENKREGILAILDENCRLASCTDSIFCRALYEKCEKHHRFIATQGQKANFVFSIDHYAGTVAYESVNFLEKNKDELPEGTTKLLASSSLKFIKYLGNALTKDETNSVERPPFTRDNENDWNLRRRNNSSILRKTVGKKFSLQLRELRDKINSTKPHYVRCLKPNDNLVPNLFEAQVISDQLRCAGVLEAIRVSRVGFPHRYFHEQFVERYSILTTKKLRQRRGEKICSSLINSLVPQVSKIINKESGLTCMVSIGMQIGYSKVFLRSSIFDALEFLRRRKLEKSVIIIQKNTRRFISHNQYQFCLMAIIKIQCFVRRITAYRQARTCKESAAAIRIQSTWRRFFAETELMASRLIAHFCQVYWRGICARKFYAMLALENQAKTIQRYWRSHYAKLQYHRALISVISIQCCWRSKAARTIYKKARRHSRNIDTISAERDRFKEESLHLRKEVKRLQSIIRMTEGSQTAISLFDDSFNDKFVDGIGNDLLPTPMFAANISPSLRSESKRSDNSDFSDGFANEDGLMSFVHSVGISSPSSSLLDADTHQDFGDYQLQKKNDSISNPSRISYVSLSDSVFDESDSEELRHQQVQENIDAKSRFEAINEMNMLHNSIRNGAMSKMNEIIEKCNDSIFLVNSPNLCGQSALHIAVESNNFRAIQNLLKGSAIVNAQDIYGNTPLHLCTTVESAQLLLESGSANPNIPNIDGICALHKAVERLDVSSVRLLLKHFAKIDVADNLNWFTPLHMAVKSSEDKINALGNKTIQKARPEIVELLCGELSRIEINEQDRDGNSPLHYATLLETTDAAMIISTILDKGADPTIRNKRNQQPLLLLLHNINLRQSYDAFQDCVHTLLHYGANPNHQSNTGCTPLHLSLYHNDIDSAIQLINHSAEIHLLWKRPSSWITQEDKIRNTDVLALDLISEENSIYRLLAAINRQPKFAPSRPWCMHCKSPIQNLQQISHCRHCGRHICEICTSRNLLPDFFPKSFDIYESSIVCIVCDNILASRKEELSNATSVTHPSSSLANEDEIF